MRSPAAVTYSPRVADQLRGQSPMAGLDRRNLGPMQVFAQSVSGAAPAAAMAVIPAIVAASAGSATIWSLAIATGLALLVAGCIGQFTRRMAAAGSLYSLTAKGLGAGPALLCGTGLMVGYSLLGMGSLTGAAMQTAALLARLGLPGAGSPAVAAVLVVLLAGLVAACTVRGVRLSAGVVLLVEALSITLMLVVFGVLLVSHGIAPDTRQLSPSAWPPRSWPARWPPRRRWPGCCSPWAAKGCCRRCSGRRTGGSARRTWRSRLPCRCSRWCPCCCSPPGSPRRARWCRCWSPRPWATCSPTC